MKLRTFLKTLIGVSVAPSIFIPRAADAYKWVKSESGVIREDEVVYYGQKWKRDESGLFCPIKPVKPRTWDDVLREKGML